LLLAVGDSGPWLTAVSTDMAASPFTLAIIGDARVGDQAPAGVRALCGRGRVFQRVGSFQDGLIRVRCGRLVTAAMLEYEGMSSCNAQRERRGRTVKGPSFEQSESCRPVGIRSGLGRRSR
jgi:hypothetical protein